MAGRVLTGVRRDAKDGAAWSTSVGAGSGSVGWDGHSWCWGESALALPRPAETELRDYETGGPVRMSRVAFVGGLRRISGGVHIRVFGTGTLDLVSWRWVW